MGENVIEAPETVIVAPGGEELAVDDVMHVEEFEFSWFSIEFPVEAAVANNNAFQRNDRGVLDARDLILLVDLKSEVRNVNA